MLQKMISMVMRETPNLIFPPVCPISFDPMQDHGALGAKAWQHLSFISKPYCVECGEPFAHPQYGDGCCVICLAPESFKGRVTGKKSLDRLRSAVAYNDYSANLVLAFKYADRHDLTALLGKLMVNAARDYWKRSDLIIAPVPLHRQRLRERRFNQAALLSQFIAKTLEAQHIPDLILRTRPTKPQQGMSAKARQRNVRNAFKIKANHKTMVAGKEIVLVDDVFTTGSTMKECARYLKKANAANVMGLTFARVVKDPLIAI